MSCEDSFGIPHQADFSSHQQRVERVDQRQRETVEVKTEPSDERIKQ